MGHQLLRRDWRIIPTSGQRPRHAAVSGCLLLGCLLLGCLLLSVGLLGWPLAAAAAPRSADVDSAAPIRNAPQANRARSTSEPRSSHTDPPAASGPAAVPLKESIEQLGAADFREREAAGEQIRRLGIDAYDVLTEAMASHTDTEVRVRASSLRNELLIRKARPEDPAGVKRALAGYADRDIEVRKDRVRQLIDNGTLAAFEALCRVARTEVSDMLSKKAALGALQISVQRDPPVDGPIRADVTRQLLGKSERAGAQWLLKRLGDQEDVDGWRSILRAEQQAFNGGSGDTDFDVINALTSVVVRIFIQHKHVDLVVPLLTESIQDSAATPWLVADVCQALVDAQAWQALDQLRSAFSTDFEANELILYRYAHSWVLRGDTARGEEIARKEFERAERTSQDRYLAAQGLETLGLFSWAEREYRRVVDDTGIKSAEGVFALYSLAELLHEQDLNLRAAEVLHEVEEEITRNDNVKEAIDEIGFVPVNSMMSRMHFLYAEHFRAQGDAAKQFFHLVKGTEQDPTDADLLIARYRFAGASPEFRQETIRLIQAAADSFRSEIVKVAVPFRGVEDFGERQIAQKCNELAWLISNTTGDLQEALNASRRSLELKPENAGYLDTLGRCYYAVGDLDQAILSQRRALRRDPHSGLLRKQLKLFEDERAKKQADVPR